MPVAKENSNLLNNHECHDERQFIDELVDFCSKSTHGRDPSHGEQHMTQVRNNAQQILDQLVVAKEYPNILASESNLEHVRRMVQAAAQFHDIADHKYVKDPSQCGVEEKLRRYFTPQDAQNIVRIMDAVSFSKERKLRQIANDLDSPVSFVSQLGEVGALVRDIVSDADKLEAIGEIGVERCLQYAQETIQLNEHRSATDEELICHLVEHAKEKLMILLCQRYVRTSAGRALALPRHNVMLDLICEKLGVEEGRQFRQCFSV